MMRSLPGPTAVLATFLVLLAGPSDTLSQEPAPVEIGTRVRVKAEGEGQRWMVGKLLELRSDSVRLLTGTPPTDSVAVALDSLAGFELSRGQRSQAGRGALIGLGTGAVLGFIIGIATYEECSGFCVFDPGRAGTGAVLAGLGGLFGLGVGALIGRGSHTDRWEPVSGQTIGVSVAF
jgi:hypothetical protein